MVDERVKMNTDRIWSNHRVQYLPTYCSCQRMSVNQCFLLDFSLFPYLSISSIPTPRQARPDKLTHLNWSFVPHNIDTLCVFRCKRGKQQLPGPVGVCQRYHRSDSTRVKGTQLSGIPALLRGNAVMWPAKVVFPRNEFCFLLFFGTACKNPPTVSVSGWREEKGRTSLYIHFSYMRRMATFKYLRYIKE